jgi:hypothetical protein
MIAAKKTKPNIIIISFSPPSRLDLSSLHAPSKKTVLRSSFGSQEENPSLAAIIVKSSRRRRRVQKPARRIANLAKSTQHLASPSERTNVVSLTASTVFMLRRKYELRVSFHRGEQVLLSRY